MKKFLSTITCVTLLIGLSACSNDNNVRQETTTIQNVQFSFTNEEFGQDEELTRTAGKHNTQTIEIGDCEAEISVESEPAYRSTRGTRAQATGHYTIRAYQSGAKKGEMSGTFSGGTFTPDATSPKEMGLAPGTYEFVAFNDDVIPLGNHLTISRNKAETSMIGTTTVSITATPRKQQVNFTMKHVGVRLRTQFICKKDIPNNITATLEATAANVIPATVAYNPLTNAYTATKGAMSPVSNNSSASTEAKYAASNYGQNYSYTSTGSYHYFLPTTEGSKLKLTNISLGTVFWKPIATFSIPQLNATLSMQQGKSYVVKIKLKPSFTYLMSDGNTGAFKETTFGGGSKTPIGIVLDPIKQIAVGLQRKDEQWCANWSPQRSTNPASNFTDLIAREDGYEETWNPSTSVGGLVKATNPILKAFNVAGEYSNGLSVSGTMTGKKWYLPAMGEFKLIVSTLGFGDVSTIPAWGETPWYGHLAALAFSQVGESNAISFSHYYWTSTEFSFGGQHGNAGQLWVKQDAIQWRLWSKVSNEGILSFVKY